MFSGTLIKRFAILLFVINVCDSSYTNSTRIENGKEDRQYAALSSCLKSMGANLKDLYRRGSGSAYDKLNFQWNSLNGYVKPLAYFLPNNDHDVRTAVLCCRLSDVRVVARSGGHSYIKAGFGDVHSLIVDLAKLNQIVTDPIQMTCEIGAGARLGQIAYTLWKNGKFLIPGGLCPNVGIAGLALGGGYGRMTTLFGLTLDNILEMEMVDAKGRLLLINNRTNSDLFWALRGAGAGNFGIVTKFKFKMHSAPASITHRRYDFHVQDFSRFYSAWQSLFKSEMPRHIYADLTSLDDGLILRMDVFAFNFVNQNETIDSLGKFIDSFKFPDVSPTMSRIMSYAELLLMDGELYSFTPLTHVSQLGNLSLFGPIGWKKTKSIFINKVLNGTEISQLKELLAEYVQHAELIAEPTRSAVTKSISSTDTAYVHREKSYFVIQLSAFAPANKPPNRRADLAMKQFYEKSKTIFHHTESYQNYADPDMVDYLTRYYGINLERLVRVKRWIDPKNVFHHPQSIPLRLN